MIETLRTTRQIRQYADEPVPDDVLRQILQVARWTGSSTNRQEWHFVVVRDRGTIGTLSRLRTPISWIAAAPVGIAIVVDNDDASHAYDEGRATERILVAAHALGYGAGIAWYGDASQQAEVKRLLGIPVDKTARQIVMIGRPVSPKDPRPGARPGGRRPLAEIVSYDRYSK
ncbi:MAG: nitroreductase family protein [Chloroflexota bacterium]|nr:nitroreductase family protein [Chloroflexota bacterium]MDE3193713.1 nitroreductase family protein [Chloroflexota bacterium]